MNTPQSSLLEFFSQDHAACDALWSKLESAADAGHNSQATELWTKFEQAMRRHFAMEEEVLFPEFERATGMTHGPTQVMRMEHAQMRSVLDQLSIEAQRGNLRGLLDHGDTLLMLIQQHNLKEEGVLYPMAEQHLAAAWNGIAQKLAKL
jgi:hemerythrin-like domain-containing protein